jgi:NADH-quinone oxidoreductase subunit H
VSWPAASLVTIFLFLPAFGALAWIAVVMNAMFGALSSGRPRGMGSLAAPGRAALRLLLKERSATPMPDALLWRFGIIIVFTAPLLAAAVIPLAPGVAVADLSVGIVWWTALMALLWVGVFLVGWGANSAYAMIGGYRFIAQALAYEMPLAIVVITIGLLAESLQVSQIVAGQADGLWYVIWAPVGFVVYLMAASAQAFWGPFSTPTAGDLAGGVKVELTGVDRLVFMVGRYLALVVAAAFATPLFLGGHHGPWLPGWLWIVIKTLIVLALIVAGRWLWPRVRIDRFEEFAWVVLIPLTLVQLFVVGALVLWLQ